MITRETIEELSDRIAEEFQPEQIILFGSFAYGHPGPDSDVDLLVIMPFEGKGSMMSAEIMNRVSPRIPVELVVRTPEEVERRMRLNDFFLREIMEKGRVLYEATHA
ncbi:MAG: nucleotidyltransferase domain-containing protein [Planctomycetota bacterium]|jgi:predicted nucleotidyltransferase|nr:nucleotidyltransferase domain-containing protein [Planctomycetota bacterium]MDP6504135.1 nucleotidyltransferase domain-containing protein [Planctomycetota bacterium]